MLVTGMSGAEIAAKNGTAYVFAHFANPSAASLDAVDSYRQKFRPSPLLDKPKVMIAVFAIVAQTEEDAEELAKALDLDRKSTRLNSSHVAISYAVFCLKKKQKTK